MARNARMSALRDLVAQHRGEARDIAATYSNQAGAPRARCFFRLRFHRGA